MSGDFSRAPHDSASVHTDGTTGSRATGPLFGGDCGQRLIVHIIDETARATPDVECVSVPRSSVASDGWEPVSWSQIANAVNYVAHMLTEQNGAPAPGTFPTVAYIGLEDPRYPIFMIGAIKAGFKALFVSPRNSLEAQLNLFEETSCDLLYHDKQYASIVQPWVNGRPKMRSVVLTAFATWITGTAVPFPYTKTFAEAEWDPMVVVHTSGSTGLPKAVVVPQGVAAGNDMHRLAPPRDGNLLWLPTWANFPNPRQLLIFPLFHAGGLFITTLCAFFYNSPVAFRPPNSPVTDDNILEWLQNCDVGWTIIPPAILDQMSRSQKAIDQLKKLHAVGFGGGKIPITPLKWDGHLRRLVANLDSFFSGPTAPDVPNRLVSNGIKAMHAIAATE
jgi:acyl-CoA synthetase (AMP-forming)/AMP-acid ligase II